MAKKQQAASNPYLDDEFMDAYLQFSPAENKKYLETHNASNKAKNQENTVPLPDIPIQNLNLNPNPNPLPSANSQDIFPNNEEDVDDPPLTKSELLALKQGDEVLLLEGDDGNNEQILIPYKFESIDEFGSINLLEEVAVDENGKKIFEPISVGDINGNEDDLPFMYKMLPPSNLNNNDNNNNENLNTTNNQQQQNENLNNDQLKVGAKILITSDDGITAFNIKSYDSSTTKAVLEDMTGCITQCHLKGQNISFPKPLNDEQFKNKLKNEFFDNMSLIETSTNNTTNNDNNNGIVAPYKRIGHSYNLSEILTPWIEISDQRVKKIKLDWISYKNTLLGSIACCTKYLYPISMDYMLLNCISGQCLSFAWCDQSKINMHNNDIIGEHLELFLVNSQIESMLNKISSISSYKFEKHVISEIINNPNKNINNLEKVIINNLNNNICTITHDNLGHLGLIIGYSQKQKQNINNENKTNYYFKLKKFGSYTSSLNKSKTSELDEYIAIDLYNQSLVITIDPPEKNRSNAVKHKFNPQLLHEILDHIIKKDDKKEEMKENNNFEYFGFDALNQWLNEMDLAKKEENVSNIFGKLTIYALIRLFDSRKSFIEFIDYVLNKITESYHDLNKPEWKFKKENDISEELKEIQKYLQEEVNQIRRIPLFDKYISKYDGQALPNKIEWEPYHRAGIKSAIELFIKNETEINKNLIKIREKIKLEKNL